MSPLTPLAFALPGGWEWLVILVVALLIFGARLPSLMRGLGGSVKEFKKGMEDGATPSTPAPPPPAPPPHAVSRDQAPAPVQGAAPSQPSAPTPPSAPH